MNKDKKLNNEELNKVSGGHRSTVRNEDDTYYYVAKCKCPGCSYSCDINTMSKLEKLMSNHITQSHPNLSLSSSASIYFDIEYDTLGNRKRNNLSINE